MSEERETGPVTMGDERRSRLSGPVLAAAFAACVIFDVLMIGPALWTDAVRAPWDGMVRQIPDVEGVRPDVEPANRYLSDCAHQFIPWSHQVRTSWLEGRVPWWNHLAGGGGPLAANVQSEVFSPYLPLNLLLGDDYWEWKQLAVMLVAQGFCLLLARRLRVGVAGALVLALGFSLGSFLQTWATHPHAGVAAFYPAIVWALLGLRQRRGWRRVGLAALTVAAAVFAGHVQTASMACLGAGLIALCHQPSGRGIWRGRTRLILQAAAAVTLALLLTSVLVGPFVEYVGDSDIGDMRRKHNLKDDLSIESPAHLLVLFDPEALGDMVAVENAYRGQWNFFETGFFMGRVVLVLALAGLGLGLVARRDIVPALLITLLVGLGSAYGMTPFDDLFRDVPPFDVLPARRMTLLAALPMAILAGIGLDLALARGRRAGRRGALVVLGVGVAAAVAGLAAVAARPENDSLAPSVSTLSWLLVAAAIVATAGLALALPSRARAALAVVLVGGVAVEGLLVWRDFVPTVPRELVHPRSEVYEDLAEKTRFDKVLPLGWGSPPEIPSRWGVASVRNFDAMGLRRFHELLRRSRGFADIRGRQLVVGADPRWLDMAGVGWTLSLFDPARAVRAEPRAVAAPDRPYRRRFATAPSRPVELFVTRPRESAAKIEVIVRGPGGAELRFDPEAPPSAPVPGLGKIETRIDGPMGVHAFAWLRSSPHWPVVFRAEAAADVDVVVEVTGGWVFVDAMLRNGVGDVESVRKGPGPLVVARRKTALPLASLAGSVVVRPTLAEALDVIKHEAFDPHLVTVVESEDDSLARRGTPSGRVSGPLEVTRPAPEELRVKYASPRPGVLVVSEAWAPGWEAWIDGHPARVLPANVVGRAVAVPRGRHEVRFRYRPRRLTLWVALSALGAVLVFGGLVSRQPPVT